MKPLCILTIFLAAGLSSQGEETENTIRFPKLRLLNGKEYTEVTVRKVSGDNVSVVHGSGVATIPFDQLSESDAKTIGLTREGVEKVKQEKVKQVEKETRSKATNSVVFLFFSRLEGRVLQVLPDGLLLSNAKTWNGKFSKFQYPDDNRVYQMPDETRVGTCFVYCKTSGYVDGEFFSSIVSVSGTTSYTNTIGGTNTVNAFRTDLESLASAYAKKYQLPSDEILGAVKLTYSHERMMANVPK